jgi:hypothetical protein
MLTVNVWLSSDSIVVPVCTLRTRIGVCLQGKSKEMQIKQTGKEYSKSRTFCLLEKQSSVASCMLTYEDFEEEADGGTSQDR